jgi:hypothetical protein
LAFSGRHLGISVWFITQKYNAVIKDFRDNIRALVQFYEKDEDSRPHSRRTVSSQRNRGRMLLGLKRVRKSKLVMWLEHPSRPMWWIIDLVELSLKFVLWLYIVIFIRKIYHIVCNMANSQKVLDETLGELGLEDADDKPSDACG